MDDNFTKALSKLPEDFTEQLYSYVMLTDSRMKKSPICLMYLLGLFDHDYTEEEIC